MAILFAVDAPVKGTSMRVQLVADEPAPNATMLELRVVVTGAKTSTIQIDVDIVAGSFTVHGLLGLSPLEACLAACAVSSVVGPLIECLEKDPKKKNPKKTDSQGYWECLKEMGVSLGADVVKCAIGCGAGTLGAAGAPSPGNP